MAKLGKRVREAVLARIAGSWAAKWSAESGNYTLSTAEAAKIAAIDWTGTKKQLFIGDVDAESLDESTTVIRPIVTLHVESIAHDGQEKFRHWSGSAAVVIRFYWEWLEGNAVPNFDEPLDALESTIAAVLHDRAWIGMIGAGVSYAGDITMGRSPAAKLGENWRRVLEVRARFGLDV